MGTMRVDEASLTAVADAIREKAGSSEGMIFPEGFVSAVAGIQAGGGVDFLNKRLMNTLTEYTNYEVKSIGSYGFYGCSALTSIDLPNVINAGQYCLYGTNIKKIYFPSLNTVGTNAFSGMPSLNEVDLPSLTDAGSNMFQDCSALQEIYLPLLENVSSYMFRRCSKLKKGIFPNAKSITTYSFNGCTVLDTLVFNANSVVENKNANSLGSTPFASGGTGGTVYVPEALIESYKTASNWSTLYNAGTCNFVAIEGSEYDTTA